MSRSFYIILLNIQLPRSNYQINFLFDGLKFQNSLLVNFRSLKTQHGLDNFGQRS